jgi:hypothetical protein
VELNWRPGSSIWPCWNLIRPPQSSVFPLNKIQSSSSNPIELESWSLSLEAKGGAYCHAHSCKGNKSKVACQGGVSGTHCRPLHPKTVSSKVVVPLAQMVLLEERRDVIEPPKIIPYYRLSLSTWPLSNNKELFCRSRRVKPGKSHTTGSLICAKPTRRWDQSTALHYIKVHKFNIITNQVFRT